MLLLIVSISRSLHIMSYSTLNGRDVIVTLALDSADGGDSVFRYSHEAYEVVAPDDDVDADDDADGLLMNDTSTGGGGLAENFALGL